jgi:hypothetical protein
MMSPQLTEQYGQVPRVSVVRASLKALTSATATPGDKPRPTAEEVATPAEQILKNCRRFIGAFICVPPKRTLIGNFYTLQKCLTEFCSVDSEPIGNPDKVQCNMALIHFYATSSICSRQMADKDERATLTRIDFAGRFDQSSTSLKPKADSESPKSCPIDLNHRLLRWP